MAMSNGCKIAKLLVKRVIDNKKHITVHGKYKLIFGDDFYYRFYDNGKLCDLTCDDEKIAGYIAFHIDLENLLRGKNE